MMFVPHSPCLTFIFAGATRLELCANLLEGGTTPSLGKVLSRIKIISLFLGFVKNFVYEDYLHLDAGQ